MVVPPGESHLLLVDPTWADREAQEALASLFMVDVSPAEARWLQYAEGCETHDRQNSAIMSLGYDGITLGMRIFQDDDSLLLFLDADSKLVLAQIPFWLADDQSGRCLELECGVISLLSNMQPECAPTPGELRPLLWRLADGTLDDYQLLDLLDREPMARPAYFALRNLLNSVQGIATAALNNSLVPKSHRVLVTGPLRSWPVARALAQRLFNYGQVEVAGMGRFAREEPYVAPDARLETFRGVEGLLAELVETDSEDRPNMFVFCREVADRFWEQVGIRLGTMWMEQTAEIHDRIEGRAPAEGGRLSDDHARYARLTESETGGITLGLLRIEERIAEGNLDYPLLCLALSALLHKVFLSELRDDAKELLRESFEEVVRRKWPQLSDTLLAEPLPIEHACTRQILEMAYIWLYDEEKAPSLHNWESGSLSGHHHVGLDITTVQEACRALIDHWRTMKTGNAPWVRPHTLELQLAGRLSRSLTNRMQVWRALGTFEDGEKLESEPLAWKGTGFPDCLDLKTTPTHEGKVASLSYYEVIAEDVRVVERWAMGTLCTLIEDAAIGLDPLGLCELQPERIDDLCKIDKTWLDPVYVRNWGLADLAASPTAL